VSNDIKSIQQFLSAHNVGAALSTKSKTLCIMDATGSMGHLIEKCKSTVGIMFERATTILIENKLSSDSYAMQFAVYRSYGEKEAEILQVSPWETKPERLREFMNSIRASGGWSEEAVEIGLWHANQDSDVSQVILIADAPATPQAQVAVRRAAHGESYWKTTKFSSPTYFMDEVRKLKSKNIKVHAFYVNTWAKNDFEKIAAETGGRCSELQINTNAGADMLTNLVTEEVLRDAGGAKGAQLVEAYQKKFAKSYNK